MDAATQRAFNGLKHSLSEAEHRAKYYEDQTGEMRLRWIAVKDQYEAHMAQAHTPPLHLPAIAPMQIERMWGVFCQACSEESGDYVYPCRVNPDNFPPPALLGPPAPAPETPDA